MRPRCPAAAQRSLAQRSACFPSGLPFQRPKLMLLCGDSDLAVLISIPLDLASFGEAVTGPPHLSILPGLWVLLPHVLSGQQSCWSCRAPSVSGVRKLLFPVCPFDARQAPWLDVRVQAGAFHRCHL